MLILKIKKRLLLPFTFLLVVLFILATFSLKPSSGKISSPISPINFNNGDLVRNSVFYYISESQSMLKYVINLAIQPQSEETKQKLLGSINQALDFANQAIANFPTDSRGFSQRAAIYQFLIPFLPESANLAIQDLKQAIELDKQNFAYHYRLAQCYSTTQDFQNAAFSFYNAYLLKPTDPQIIWSLADAAEKSNQKNLALSYFKKLTDLLMPDDQNLEIINLKIQNLLSFLPLDAQATQNLIPQPPSESPPPSTLGTQDLALNQLASPQGGVTPSVVEGLTLPSAGQAEKKPLIIAASQESTSPSNQPPEITLNGITGEDVIPAGQTEILIENINVTDDKPIFVAPLGDSENKVLFLSAKKAADPDQQTAWFKVAIDKPTAKDISFRWWIPDKL